MKKLAIAFLFSILFHGKANALNTTYSNEQIQNVNISKVNGIVLSTGAGASGPGTIRVILSSDTSLSVSFGTSTINAVIVGSVTIANVSGGTLTTDATTYRTIAVSTVACGTTLTMIFSTNTARVSNLVCNEGSSAVRLGPSTITATVGQYFGPNSCITYDKPRYFIGSLWCISTTGSAQAISATEGTP